MFWLILLLVVAVILFISSGNEDNKNGGFCFIIGLFFLTFSVYDIFYWNIGKAANSPTDGLSHAAAYYNFLNQTKVDEIRTAVIIADAEKNVFCILLDQPLPADTTYVKMSKDSKGNWCLVPSKYFDRQKPETQTSVPDKTPREKSEN